MEAIQAMGSFWDLALAKLKPRMKNSPWSKRGGVQEEDTNPARRFLQMKVKMKLKVRAVTYYTWDPHTESHP